MSRNVMIKLCYNHNVSGAGTSASLARHVQSKSEKESPVGGMSEKDSTTSMSCHDKVQSSQVKSDSTSQVKSETGMRIGGMSISDSTTSKSCRDKVQSTGGMSIADSTKSTSSLKNDKSMSCSGKELVMTEKMPCHGKIQSTGGMSIHDSTKSTSWLKEDKYMSCTSQVKSGKIPSKASTETGARVLLAPSGSTPRRDATKSRPPAQPDMSVSATSATQGGVQITSKRKNAKSCQITAGQGNLRKTANEIVVEKFQHKTWVRNVQQKHPSNEPKLPSVKGSGEDKTAEGASIQYDPAVNFRDYSLHKRAKFDWTSMLVEHGDATYDVTALKLLETEVKQDNTEFGRELAVQLAARGDEQIRRSCFRLPALLALVRKDHTQSKGAWI